MFLNPAATGFLPPTLVVGAHGLLGESARTGDEHTWGVVLADGSTDKWMPGAFSYIREKTESATGTLSRDHEFRLSIAKLAYPGFSVGFGAHYREHEIQGGANHFQANADFGVLWQPVPMFSLGFSAQNVLSTDAEIPENIRDTPTLGLGVSSNYNERLVARLDIVRPERQNPDRRIDVGAGLETIFSSGLSLRLGCNWKESAGQTLFGSGIGYRGPRLQVDYAYQTDARLDREDRHLIDLWIPF